jgi:deoxyribodipyrimidine photolyase-related protein
MRCLQQVVLQLKESGYAHHIQRLMVTGLFAQLFGVEPSLIYEWFVATHIDSVEWVTAPNVLGMSQYADGGIVATKPYIASGKYIERMSNYCTTCTFNAGEATGDKACPFTTLYWNYLIEHEPVLRSSPRMRMQLRNLDRKTDTEKQAIAAQANTLRTSISTEKAIKY